MAAGEGSGRGAAARHAAARAMIEACLEMQRAGINQGTSGNVSVRWGEGVLITPSAMPYGRMTPDDIVHVAFDGTVSGRRRPSTEWRFHVDIHRARPDVGAVVHAHPVHATALAILGRSIPAVHYMVAAAGGADIRCADYATFGTEALSRAALAALTDRQACLLAHHGIIAVGPSLERALWLAGEVETLARQYHAALQIGTPPELPADEMARVQAAMAGYGLDDEAQEGGDGGAAAGAA